jgi:hypothetical protein
MISKKNIILLLGFAFLSFSIFIKFAHIDKIYTEIDDIGVISLHKHYPSDKSINIFGKDITIEKEKIQNLENSILFSSYITFNWTYSPIQYLSYKIVDYENIDYKSKIIFSKLISLTISIFCAIYFFIFLFITMKKKLYLSIFIVFILFNSFNFSIYSLHMSPYMSYLLSTIIGLYFIENSKKKLNLLPTLNIIFISLYLGYMNFIFILILIFTSIRDKKFFYNLNILFNKKKKYLIFYFLLLAPLFLLFIIKSRTSFLRGKNIDGISNIEEFFYYIYHQSQQVFDFLFLGFFPDLQKLNFLYFIFFLFLFVFYILRNKKNYIFSICLYYLLIWICLHFLNLLPFDQTRHSLIFYPIILIILSEIIPINSYSKYTIIFMIVLLYPLSIFNLNKVLHSKKDNFDLNILKNEKTKNLIIYSGTTHTKLFFNKNDFNIIDFNIGLDSYSKKFPEEAILTSQDMNYIEYSKLNKDFENFLKLYHIKKKLEKNSMIYMPYNNYNVNSNQNGQFVYELKLRSN